MVNQSLLDEICQLNLSYLVLAQRMLHDDIHLAMFRLKLSPNLAQALSNASFNQLAKLAKTNQLLCRLTIEDEAIFKRLTESTSLEDIQRIHGALLLTNQLKPSNTNSEIYD